LILFFQVKINFLERNLSLFYFKIHEKPLLPANTVIRESYFPSRQPVPALPYFVIPLKDKIPFLQKFWVPDFAVLKTEGE